MIELNNYLRDITGDIEFRVLLFIDVFSNIEGYEVKLIKGKWVLLIDLTDSEFPMNKKYLDIEDFLKSIWE